jgi:hypothetical protein
MIFLVSKNMFVCMKYVYFLIRTNPNMPVDKAKGFENNNPSDSLPALLMLIMIVTF